MILDPAVEVKSAKSVGVLDSLGGQDEKRGAIVIAPASSALAVVDAEFAGQVAQLIQQHRAALEALGDESRAAGLP
jgi:stress-induced morphogen